MKHPWLLLARALALLWAGFWMFFFVVESWSWHTPLGHALLWAGAGLLFILLALIPWRWERLGGILLVVVGFAAAVAYAIWSPASLPAPSRLLTALLMGGPPIAAGTILLMHHHIPGRAHIGAARG